MSTNVILCAKCGFAYSDRRSRCPVCDEVAHKRPQQSRERKAGERENRTSVSWILLAGAIAIGIGYLTRMTPSGCLVPGLCARQEALIKLAQPPSTSGKSSKQSRYYLKATNIDDYGYIIINGSIEHEVSYLGPELGWTDITDKLRRGRNKVTFRVENGPSGGWTYGFSLKKDNKILWEDYCGRKGALGCNDNDTTTGIVFEKTLYVTR